MNTHKLTLLQTTFPCHRGTRVRSERSPVGPAKYAKVLGESMSKQNFRFLRSSKKSNFSKTVRHITDPRGQEEFLKYNCFNNENPS